MTSVRKDVPGPADDQGAPSDRTSKVAADWSRLSIELRKALEALTAQVASRRGAEGNLTAAPPDSPTAPAWLAVALCTLEGRFIEVNDRFADLSGRAKDELIGHAATELSVWAPGEMEAVLRLVRQRGALDGNPLAYRTQTGETQLLLLAARLLTVNGRGCVLVVGADPNLVALPDEAAL